MCRYFDKYFIAFLALNGSDYKDYIFVENNLLANCYKHYAVENSNMTIIKNSILWLENYIPLFLPSNGIPLKILSPTTEIIFTPRG